MPRPRLSIGNLMMVILAAATASALFARIYEHIPTPSRNLPGHPIHLTAEFVLSIVVTALALAALKQHSLVLALIQVTLTCLALLVFIGLKEWHASRLQIYWFQGCFVGLVAIPLACRRRFKAALPRGAERRARMQACEAVAFAFPNMVLVLSGVFLQALLFESAQGYLKL